MKYYTITELAKRVGKNIPDTYTALAENGIFPSPDHHCFTEKGKQYGKEQYIENDRYGRSYWLQTFSSQLIDIIRNS